MRYRKICGFPAVGLRFDFLLLLLLLLLVLCFFSSFGRPVYGGLLSEYVSAASFYRRFGRGTIRRVRFNSIVRRAPVDTRLYLYKNVLRLPSRPVNLSSKHADGIPIPTFYIIRLSFSHGQSIVDRTRSPERLAAAYAPVC